MHNLNCLKRIVNKLAGDTVCDANDKSIHDVLCKMQQYVKPIPDPAKFVVNVTGDTTAATADKTLAQIKAAHDAGKVVECHYSAFALHPLMISDSVCSFSCDVMSTATTCQRTTINITAAGAGIAVLNYELTPAS